MELHFSSLWVWLRQRVMAASTECSAFSAAITFSLGKFGLSRNNTEERITSPARGRKGLVSLHTAFRCSGMQFIRPQITYFMSTLLIDGQNFIAPNTSFPLENWKTLSSCSFFNSYPSRAAALAILKILYSLHPPQDLYGHSLRAP